MIDKTKTATTKSHQQAIMVLARTTNRGVTRESKHEVRHEKQKALTEDDDPILLMTADIHR